MKPKLYQVNVSLGVDYEGLLGDIAYIEAEHLKVKSPKDVVLVKTLIYLKHIRNEVEHRHWAQIKEQRKKEAEVAAEIHKHVEQT